MAGFNNRQKILKGYNYENDYMPTPQLCAIVDAAFSTGALQLES